ncbi:MULTISPECIES: class I adenylate-forming enzyme family protein [Limibacillus]|jgi:acyl-CoA synthetase (AMP-forming)/AMP-acid ligase II|uniref:Acyl-CoA synthetase (AMP-forming)/AMP-acid ligase II n=1 Tax=Limibacillus halophilus TaxID=1579333 RepID=A0A839SRC0_9PROT|nr:class I adenylate-forming enzyme family protein [Limibacillus halophilus]MBB3064280.1 acyl-CoA synthetase (AMP-forming)/AMP-acid ligase II [Limibacillus halophilus]
MPTQPAQPNAGTLLDRLWHWASATPDKLAVETLADGQLTYRELAEKSDSFAAALWRLGIGPGDHIAIQLPSVPEFLVAYYAACRIGAVLTTMHVPYRQEELRPMLKFAKARAAICTVVGAYDAPETMLALAGEIDSLDHVIVVGNSVREGCLSFDAMVESGDPTTLPPMPGPNATCTLCFTSGTAAAPKGVERKQGLMAENAARFVEMIEMTGDDRVMIAPPLTHVFGLLCSGNAVYCGATILPVPLFTPQTYVDFLTTLAPTVIYSAPAHLAATLKSGVLDREPPPSVRDVIVGGSICPPEVARQFEDKLPNGRVGCLFGMTEALLTTQTDIHGTPEERHGTVGKLADGLALRIVDDAGNSIEAPDCGELQLSGYSILSEYCDNPEANASSFTADGWFRTGDLAYLDEKGNIVITGRLKDIINRGGIKINPADIESLLDGHENIIQSAIVPMPDEVLGERICLYVVLKPGSTITLEEVLAYLQDRGTAKMRWPERLEIVDEMPMTPTRKIRKAILITDIRNKMAS